MGLTTSAYDPPLPEPAGRARVTRMLLAPVSPRTWLELLHVLTGLPVAVVTFCFTVTMLATGAGLLVTFLGVPVLAAGLAGCRALGSMERTRARVLLDFHVDPPEPVRTLQRKQGMLAWVGALFRSGTSWRSLLYTVLHFPWSVAAFTVTVAFWSTSWALLTYPLWFWTFPDHLDQPGIQLSGRPGDGWYLDSAPEIAGASALGLLLVLLCPWVVRALTQVDRLMLVGLLGPSKLAHRVAELESDRGAVVDTAAA
ncbi:sensor domain-containing protein, partial [Streptomyces oceani]